MPAGAVSPGGPPRADTGGPTVVAPPEITAPPRETLTVVAPFAPGAEVSIDGGAFELLPVDRRPVGSGLRRLVVRAPGRRTFDGGVFVMQGQPMVFELSPDEFPELMGSAQIDVTARGAVVAIDGVSVDGPPFVRPVAVGPHLVEVSAPGYSPKRFDVQVSADENKRYAVTLTRPGRSPLVWGAVGVALAAAAGVALAAARDAQEAAEAGR